jgi:hypothetical protein
MTPEAMPQTGETGAEDAYRRRARERYVGYSDHDVEIDENAAVSMSDDGAFVAAWVWVPREEVEETDA